MEEISVRNEGDDLPNHGAAHHEIERFFATSEARARNNSMVVGRAWSRSMVCWSTLDSDSLDLALIVEFGRSRKRRHCSG